MEVTYKIQVRSRRKYFFFGKKRTVYNLIEVKTIVEERGDSLIKNVSETLLYPFASLRACERVKEELEQYA